MPLKSPRSRWIIGAAIALALALCLAPRSPRPLELSSGGGADSYLYPAPPVDQSGLKTPAFYDERVTVPDHSLARVLSNGKYVSKVQVMDGPMKGRSGWVFTSWLK